MMNFNLARKFFVVARGIMNRGAADMHWFAGRGAIVTLAIAGYRATGLGSYRLFGSYRAALALAVVVSHSQAMLGPNFLQHAELGNIAVMSFFILSGFIISEAGSTFYCNRPLAFLVNRFWRIAPIYWLALAVSVAVHFGLTKAGLLTFPDDYATPPRDLFSLRTITANMFGIFPFLARTGLTGDAGYVFVRFALCIMALMPALIIILGRMPVGRDARTVDRRLGDLSYPLYLTHYTVLVLMASLTAAHGWTAFVVTLVGSVCLSWLVALAVETPLRSIRNRIRGVSLD
jgi:peptidoglycan/LPS O-acetylase OafA/YrhL